MVLNPRSVGEWIGLGLEQLLKGIGIPGFGQYWRKTSGARVEVERLVLGPLYGCENG